MQNIMALVFGVFLINERKKQVNHCENFEDGKCRYYQALIRTDEEPPTGMDESNGDCNAIQERETWDMVEDEDCDMLDRDIV